MQQLATDTGARFVPGLRAATLGAEPDGHGYVDMMRENTRLIVDNLLAVQASSPIHAEAVVSPQTAVAVPVASVAALEQNRVWAPRNTSRLRLFAAVAGGAICILLAGAYVLGQRWGGYR